MTETDDLFIHLGGKGFMRMSGSGVPPLSPSLHYGDAIFEGMSIFERDGRIGLFHPSLNIERMRYNAERLLFGFPELMDAEIISVIFRLVLMNGWGSGLPESAGVEKAGGRIKRAYVRNLLFSNNNGIGLGTPVKPEMLTAVVPMGRYLKSDGSGVSLMLFPTARKLAFPNIKGSGNYQLGMYSRRVLERFNQAGGLKCYETLFLNGKGNIAEGSGENVIIVRGNELITPALEEDVLMGISVRLISGIADEMGMEFRFGGISLADVKAADGMFMSGNAAGIVPVEKIVETDSDYGVKGVIELPSGKNSTILELKRRYEGMETWGQETTFHTFLDEWFPEGVEGESGRTPGRFSRDAEHLRERFGINRYGK